MNHSSIIFSKYLSDETMQEIVSDRSLIRNMITFEIALAKVQAKAGVIPATAASEIGKVFGSIGIEPADLSGGTLQNGIPVVSFLSLIRERLSDENQKYLHHQATSQDVMDTAQSMIIRDAITVIKNAITGIIPALTDLRARHGATKCMARTRGQLAAPITFGNKVDTWLTPIEQLLKQLSVLENEVVCVQLGGPVGTYDDEGIARALATELNLGYRKSWHSQRNSLSDFTNWLATLTGILGKMGSDILTMAQSEVGEVKETAGGGGKSSSMPHKNNPVLSEALIAIARINAGFQSIQLQSVIHSNERDGAALIIEWSVIPRMLINTATALTHASKISTDIKVNAAVMEKNVSDFLAKGKTKSN